MPKGDVDFTYDERDRVSEITGNDFHYRYQHGHAGYETLLQQEELLSGSFLQMLNNDMYGAPNRIYDGFGWNKHFEYDSVALGGCRSPK